VKRAAAKKSLFNHPAMSQLIYAAIDNGLDGGLVCLDSAGHIVDRRVMPVLKLGKGRRVDPLEIRKWYCEFAPEIVLLEQVAGSKNARSASSMADSFARIETTLIFCKARRETLTARKWQSKFWTRPKMAKGSVFDTKAAALKVANELWPEENWRKSKLATTPHDGMVDAALMAEYARLKYCKND